jgi:multidrug efflux pump subunit AcrA (membrane-fusion protein)
MTGVPNRPEHRDVSQEPRLVRLESRDGIGPRFPRRLLLGVLAIVPVIAIIGVTVVPRVWLPSLVSGNGWIEPSESRTVRAPRQGRLLEVLVAPGEAVEAGQALARMDDQKIREDLTDVDHEARLLRLEQQRATVERETAHRDLVVEGETAELDLIDARNTLLAQSFVFLNREVDVDSVLEHHVPGRHIGIDEAVNHVRRIETRLAGLRLRQDASRVDRLDSLRIAERMLQIEARRRALERARDASILRAPMGGVVQSADLDQLPDRWLAEGEAVLDVAQPGSWQARLHIPAASVHRVRPGARVRLSAAALSDLTTEPLSGVVRQVSARALERDTGAGDFLVLASVELPTDTALAGALRAGFSVRGDIITEPASLWTLVVGRLRRAWAAAR